MYGTPHEARAAIRKTMCDAGNVFELLSTLENEYGQWLKDNDLLGSERGNGYAELIDAIAKISEFADWYSGAVRAAAKEPASSVERAVQGYVARSEA